jgi:hypothetical protein
LRDARRASNDQSRPLYDLVQRSHVPTVIGLFAIAALAMGCADTGISGPSDNVRPTTTIAFDTINTRLTSRVRAAWYGDDPDGFVRGFLYSWDRRLWYFTRRNDSVFALALAGAEERFELSVISVDNTARTLPVADTALAIPFADANGNGMHDDGEEFPGMEGATDPTPARLTYAIVNSPPIVFFGDDSTALSRRAVELPDTTFTVATFRWRGFDIDGDETIVRYEWSLNDSSASAAWRALPASARTITIRESDGLLVNSDNRFFLRAVDAAGAVSAVATMPGEGEHWYVRKPKGPILVIRDYTLADGAAAFYAGVLDTLAGGRFAGRWDELDIRRGSSGGSYGALVPRIIDPMFIETLKLFDAVIWYGDNNPTLSLAQRSLPAYVRAGGHVLMTTALPSTVDPQGALLDFVPLDSVATSELPSSVPGGARLLPQPLPDGAYPVVEKGTGSIFVHPLYPSVTGEALYRLSAFGEPVVAVRSQEKRVVFLGVQLHKLAIPGVGAAIWRVVIEDFAFD